jgi:phage-related protein
MALKNFKFVNEAAKRAYKKLPPEIQKQFGADLNAVQQGERPFSDIKNVSGSVGLGAIELIENGSPAYRAIYCAKYLDTVYILHAFTKTTNGVDQAAMRTASQRYSLMKADIAQIEKKATSVKRTAKGAKPR